MFDVRPVDRSGDLDWERIETVGRGKSAASFGETMEISHEPESPTNLTPSASPDSTRYSRDVSSIDPFPGSPGFYEEAFLSEESVPKDLAGDCCERNIARESSRYRSTFDRLDSERNDDVDMGTVRDTGRAVRGYLVECLKRTLGTRRAIVILSGSVLGLMLAGFIGTQLVSLKGSVLGESTEGVLHISRALDDLGRADFESSARSFREAQGSFSVASSSLGYVGGELAKAARFVPFLSKVSSGHGLLEGAEYLSSAGMSLSRMITLVPGVSGDLDSKSASFLDLIAEAEVLAKSAAEDLAEAESAFDRVDSADVPEESREMFLMIQERLPEVRDAVAGFGEHSFLIRELLGENGPRLYLFLFQNHHELRPTGGFIGSYGLLEVKNGHIDDFFIDGIFNPDGQLREDIVPPRPMRKMTAAWSLHDSNWWPDFPRSAEKAISFYEKTGGPTVDGIITLTPVIMRDILRITGPIDMPEYGVTVDADNFMPVIQEEVEENYDRSENRPKKILSDLAPILLDRLLSSRDAVTLLALADVLSEGLAERHILLYSRNEEIQSLLEQVGWSGSILRTDGDYASVVHTNINGFKTDGVIEDTVEHSSDIRADGSVIDTIRITRKHTGGDTGYDWWDRVNSDYMRVYVPLGSELLSASGHTYEFIDDPIDYETLGFESDPDLEREEREATVHESGTRISEESGKTVFGNWVYVSPGESVTVEYTYLLPFRVFPSGENPASYSLLYQKQSGVESLDFRHTLSFPSRFAPVWYSEGLVESRNGYILEETISSDTYAGTVFVRP